MNEEFSTEEEQLAFPIRNEFGENPYIKNLNKIEFVVTMACTGKCKHCSEEDPENIKTVSFDANGDVLNGNVYETDILEIIRTYRP